jgi:hypothetical protein
MNGRERERENEWEREREREREIEREKKRYSDNPLDRSPDTTAMYGGIYSVFLSRPLFVPPFFPQIFCDQMIEI